jgi:hypothetical protein
LVDQETGMVLHTLDVEHAPNACWNAAGTPPRPGVSYTRWMLRWPVTMSTQQNHATLHIDRSKPKIKGSVYRAGLQGRERSFSIALPVSRVWHDVLSCSAKRSSHPLAELYVSFTSNV